MTFFELNEPRDMPTIGAFSKFKQSFGNIVRSMQYARMLQAMSQLTDEQLERVGLTRADIPRAARDAIYDPEA